MKSLKKTYLHSTNGELLLKDICDMLFYCALGYADNETPDLKVFNIQTKVFHTLIAYVHICAKCLLRKLSI